MQWTQIAEKMRIEPRQKQLTLTRELAIKEVKLKAVAEEFGETVEPTGHFYASYQMKHMDGKDFG